MQKISNPTKFDIALNNAIWLAGSLRKAGKWIGVSPQAFYGYRERQSMPPKKAIMLERCANAQADKIYDENLGRREPAFLKGVLARKIDKRDLYSDPEIWDDIAKKDEK